MKHRNTMKEPKVIEMFADNGEHSHWQLINEEGEVIWSEDSSEITPPANSENWIPLSEQKPEPQTMVLAKIDRGEGKTWVILAKFIPARTVLAEDFFEDYDEDDMDYYEEDDQYYVPETWVECSWFGNDLMFHSEPVIEWRPII